MGSLKENIRRRCLDDIITEIEQIEILKAMDKRHDYDPDWKDWYDVITAMRKRLMKLMKEYEKLYGSKLDRNMLKRAFIHSF
jgi:hypothetical protein